MDKLALCRICLANDIPMRLIVNKCLQAMYEVLTKLPFVTDDIRPMLVCYICCAKLHNSYKLAKNCLRSEEFFQQILSTDACLLDVQQIPTTKSFCMTEVVHDSCPVGTEVLVEEQPPVCAVEVKEELTEDVSPMTIHGSLQANAMCYLEPRYHLEFKPTIQLEPYDFINCVKTEPLEGVECSDVTALRAHGDAQQASYLIPLDAVDIQVQPCRLATDEEMKINEAAQSGNLQDYHHIISGHQALHGNPDFAGSGVTYSEAGQTFNPCVNSIYELEIIPQAIPPNTNDLASPPTATIPTATATAHNTSHTTHKCFECNICNKSFSSKYNLDRHSRTHTTVNEPFECDVCKKCFRQKVNFLRHMHSHTSGQAFQCDVCNKQFKENICLVRHQARMHANNTGGERKHLQCDVCHKYFRDNSKLQRHARTHTGEKPFECDICYKRYCSSTTLTAHHSTHTGDKMFECDVCNKRFSSRIYLVRHSRYHSEDKAYQCDVCKKHFRESDKLAAHVRTHTGEKPFECPVCQKRYSSKRHLSDHITVHNSDTGFECDVCGKCLTNKYNLERHARSHNDVKSFECDVCKKSFRENYQLARHVRRHTGESAVACGECGKRCSSKYGLAVHARAHSGERPFQCDACARRFRTKNHLIAHLRVHRRRQLLLHAPVPPDTATG